MLEPDQRDISGVLGFLHLFAPLALEAGEALCHAAAVREGTVQGDRILHGQLGAAADRKMRARLGIANQHEVVSYPAATLDLRKSPPEGTVRQQPMALELVGEDALEK